MEVPKELRWIGKLFLVGFLVLWGSRGVAILLALLVFPLTPFLIVPNVIIVISIAILVNRFGRQYWLSGIVLILSLVFSGVMLEYIPIPWIGPGPPPPVPPVFPVSFMSPILLIPTLIGGLASGILIPLVFSLLTLTILPYPTFYVMYRFTKEEMDAVHAILWFVLIITCWTLLVVPFGFEPGFSMFVTPVPLGPLVALNMLPYSKLRISVVVSNEDETQESE